MVESEKGSGQRDMNEAPGRLGTARTLPGQQQAHDVRARHPPIHLDLAAGDARLFEPGTWRHTEDKAYVPHGVHVQ